MSEVHGDHREVERAVAAAVDALPGVLRLEPTLARAIARLSRSQGATDEPTDDAAGRPADSAKPADSASDADEDADGVSMTTGGDGVDVTVEISVVGPGSVLDTVVSVRQVVQKQLAVASLRAAAVSVRVLAVDAGTPEANVAAHPHEEQKNHDAPDDDDGQQQKGHDRG